MKFKGEPNLFVRIANKNFIRTTRTKGFTFDENGIYETDNPVLCKIIGQHFKAVEETSPDTKAFKCKLCDFETDSKGKLLAHYRSEHPKEV